MDGTQNMKLYVTYGSPYARLARIIIIEKGLEAGQKVVVSNQFRLQPGSHVRANTPGPTGAKLARTGEGNCEEPAP